MLINGVSATNNVTVIPLNTILNIEVEGNISGVTSIGSRFNFIDLINGQIHSIRLTDLTNPQNSRFYPSIVRSESMPSDLVLVDESNNRRDIQEETQIVLETSGPSVSDGLPLVPDGEWRAGVQYFVSYDVVMNGNWTVGISQSSGGTVTAGTPLTRTGSGASSGLITPEPFSDSPAREVRFGMVGQGGQQTATFSNIQIYRSSDGILTNFPAAQRWVPVLGSNQAYSGTFSGSGPGFDFNNGVDTTNRTLTSDPAPNGASGSWGAGAPGIPVGSLIRSGVVLLQMIQVTGGQNTVLRFAIANGTNAQIQAAFQYPNVFDIDPFDSATEAYNSGRNDGNFTRGVNTTDAQFSSTPVGTVTGSYSGNALNLNNYVATANNGATVRLVAFGTDFSLRYTVISGTNAEIQAGFQWPNHFTVTPP